MAHQYPVTEYSLFGGSDSEGDGIILPEKDQDWNPNQAPPVPPDYPLSDDESPIITLKKKKGKSKGHRANNTAFKNERKKPVNKVKKNMKMDSAIEDAYARMHAAMHAANRKSSVNDKQSRVSVRLVRRKGGATGEENEGYTWAEQYLRAAYEAQKKYEQNEIANAGRNCLLNGVEQLPLLIKEQAASQKNRPSLKRKRPSKKEKAPKLLNNEENEARKKRALDLFQQRKPETETLWNGITIPVAQETKKPNKPKHNRPNNNPYTRILSVGEPSGVKIEPVGEKANLDNDDDDFSFMPSYDQAIFGIGEEEAMDEGNKKVEAKERRTNREIYEPSDSKWAKVHVGGLDPDTTWKPLQQFFKHCGKILRVDVKHGRGYAFIEFSKQEEARNAIDDMNGRTLNNGTITVSWARDRSTQHRRNKKGHRGYRFREERNRTSNINFVPGKNDNSSKMNLHSYQPLQGGNTLNQTRPVSPGSSSFGGGFGGNTLSTYRPVSPGRGDDDHYGGLPRVNQKSSGDIDGFDDMDSFAYKYQ